MLLQGVAVKTRMAHQSVLRTLAETRGVQCRYFYSEVVKIPSKEKEKPKKKKQSPPNKILDVQSNGPLEPGQRLNELNIQMISESMYKQLFNGLKANSVKPAVFNEVKSHLDDHELLNKPTTRETNVDFKLPDLIGGSLQSHFENIAGNLGHSYLEHAKTLATSNTPPVPQTWVYTPGWTKYDPLTNSCVQVDYPDSDALIFDVELLVKEGNFPTMATAVSPTAWYSWCSERIFTDERTQGSLIDESPDVLIPMETASGKTQPDGAWRNKLIIGHNVGFDRSFIKEQYYAKGSKTRFLDTMSMHIAVGGLTSLQRMLYVAHKSGSNRKEVKQHAENSKKRGNVPNFTWTRKSTLNNLNDVYQHYCKGAPPLEKSTRDTFVSGTMQDVRDDFQNLMTYCAKDVLATHKVFKRLWPQFSLRFPHPVTFCGMLEMGTAYLPVNDNWKQYIKSADAANDIYVNNTKETLVKLATEASDFVTDTKYADDVWLWDMDWKAYKISAKSPRFPLTGYPKWYVELCKTVKELKLENVDPAEVAKPVKLSTQRRVTPKLMRLTWDGFPLHHNAAHGWGYIVPDLGYKEEKIQKDEEDEEDADKGPVFPRKALLEVVQTTRKDWLISMQGSQQSNSTFDEVLVALGRETEEEEQWKLWKQLKGQGWESKKDAASAKSTKVPAPSLHSGAGPYTDVLPGCLFYRLPHKDGGQSKVGNPLSKDFLPKIEEGILSSFSSTETETILQNSKKTSYWKNNQDRIRGQMAVKLREEDLPTHVTDHPDYEEGGFYGAIVPRLISAGTVTRRAVEKTWLTASNAYVDRVGSELKAMVQSPPGYHFVGADVDSQELWIASLMGDAHFAGIHGCTALGWMTLQGNKADGTDLHSKVAALVGISRDQAKVFNYSRIYGAGSTFAAKLLKQFNSRLTDMEARSKAGTMYQATKGKRKTIKAGSDWSHTWQGGSESYMFNRLEEIAREEEPRTPVLGCMITKTLQPQNVQEEFMTSRVNWGVQSSAVDYLHLMLVTMKWLCDAHDIDARFCISIHDEVRYLVKSEDRYRAALALQITNLLTRAMFAQKLGMNDLPQCVAFFSAVDIDTCLRKEVTMDCVTPSNPDGLHKGYSIPPGEALTIYDILRKTSSSLTRNTESAGSSVEKSEGVIETPTGPAIRDHTEYKKHCNHEKV